MAKILIVDDEESIRYTLKIFLERDGQQVMTASNYHEALDLIGHDQPELIFADIIMENGTGIDLLKAVKTNKLECPVVLITGEPNISTAAKAVQLGAFDYLSKPINKKTVLSTTAKALKYNRLKADEEAFRRNLEAVFQSVQEGIVTTDQNMAIKTYNSMADRICGPWNKSRVGEKYGDLNIDCSQACKRVIEETLIKGTPIQEYVVECRHHLRPNQIVAVKSSPLMETPHQFSGAVMMIRDITPMPLAAGTTQRQHQFHNIIGSSQCMQNVFSMISYLANTETTALITGDTGTGKELVARAMHNAGKRAGKPLVIVNCSALNENLLESELFGHVKGAFTGALKDKVGRFEEAGEGTLFLDEIGDISERIQLKLLRVIQEREVERVGDSKPVKLNMRLIAATNKDLKKKVASGEFREDLYYRLKVIQLYLPALRQRTDDIPLLVDHFCSKFNNLFEKEIAGVSDDVLNVFMAYEWPGNIRELEHTIEHAFVLCPGAMITMDYLPGDFVEATSGRAGDVDRAVSTKEAEHFKNVLNNSGWNKARAARLLGVSRQTLYRKIKSYNLVDPVSL